MDNRFKLIFLVAVLFLTSLPVIGILKGTDPPPTPPQGQGDRPGSSLTEEQDVPKNKTGNGDPSFSFREDEMVKVPAGEFILGSDEGGYNEKPAHVAYLETFWIDKFEVTNRQYLEFVEATGHRHPGPPSRYARSLEAMRGPSQPVTYVSWQDAETYCEWKGKRLPTEKEWEKAMRGPDGRTWPWGDGLGQFPANFSGDGDGFQVTAPVGSFPKDQSVYGVFDGAGNVMEWVADWYEEDLYRQDPKHSSEKKGAPSTYKTLRGGGYTSRGVDLRITNRSFMVPDFRDETIGFRCASSTHPKNEGESTAHEKENFKENQSSRG
jgi:formylglycine-generating enzyme